MGQPAKQAVELRRFTGMTSNADPHDIGGDRAVVQVNLMSQKPGELIVRRGLRELKFDEAL